jgi:hypothetical protein
VRSGQTARTPRSVVYACFMKVFNPSAAKATASLLVGLSLPLLGCGDNNPINPANRTEVSEISADDSSIQRGDGTVVRVNFIFNSSQVFLNREDVNLVIRLDPGLVYRNESGELSGFGSRDRDVDPSVIQCPDGASFLVFDLGRSQLDDAEVFGSPSSAQLKFTADGVNETKNAAIEARADEGEIPFDCAENFRSDEQEFVSVEARS